MKVLFFLVFMFSTISFSQGNNDFPPDSKKQKKEAKRHTLEMLIEDFEGTIEACKTEKIPIACMALEKGKQYQLSDCKSDKTKPICKLKF